MRRKRNLSNRILAVVLSILLAGGGLQGSALTVRAADANVPPAGQDSTPAQSGSHSLADHAGWTEWTDGSKMPNQAGNYYLNVDEVNLSGEVWTVPVGTTNLCLNGKSIVQNKTTRVIVVPDGATLNLYDENKQGKITGGLVGGGSSGTTSERGGGILVQGGGKFIMYGGQVTDNEADFGGGICVNGSATCTMYGGQVTKNKGNYYHSDGAGGGIFVEGTFTMESGSIISENISTQAHGGGISVQDGGKAYMNGGEITYNEAHELSETEKRCGGGVYIGSGSTFEMSDGTISNNIAYNSGGGVNVNGTFKMSGGTISGNTAQTTGTTDCGGGGIGNWGKVILTGGTITGNYAKQGAGVYNGSGSNLELSGKLVIEGNLHYVPTEADKTDGVVDNLYLYSSNKIAIGDGGLTEGAYIGIKTQSTPSGSRSVQLTQECDDYSKYFASDVATYGIKYDNSTRKIYLAVLNEITYALNDDKTIITQTQTFQDNTVETATATLSLDNTVSLGYTGSEIKPVKVTYTSNWVGDKPEVTYTNNDRVGTATASLTVGGQTAELNFEITSAGGSETDAHEHAVCGGSCTHETTHNDITYTAVSSAEDLIAAAESGGNYYLASSVEVTSNEAHRDGNAVVKVKNNFNLCLNGNTLSIKVDESNRANGCTAMSVDETADFTLCDCSSEKNGKLINDTYAAGATRDSAVPYVIYTEGTGDITLYGGTVTNNNQSWVMNAKSANGNVIFDGATMEGNSVIGASDGKKVTVKSGKVGSENGTSNVITAKNLEVEGGTINGKFVQISSAGQATFTSGTVNAGIWAGKDSVVEIGGDTTINPISYFYCVAPNNQGQKYKLYLYGTPTLKKMISCTAGDTATDAPIILHAKTGDKVWGENSSISIFPSGNAAIGKYVVQGLPNKNLVKKFSSSNGYVVRLADDDESLQLDKTLDISSTSIPDANFRSFLSENYDADKDNKLYIGDIMKITSMDVSGKEISNLKGIENFTELTTLNCSGNHLAALDLSQNTKLTTLDASENTVKISSCSQYDLGSLAGKGMDPTKVSNVEGATKSDTVLTSFGGSGTITYTYDVGNSVVANPTFTLTYDHAYSAWELTKDPKETETGTAERTCSGCNKKEIKTDVPNLNDTTTWKKGDYVAPQKGTEGSQTYTSTDYGTVIVVIPALEWTVADVKAIVEEALAGITATNATTKADIQSVIDEALTEAGISGVTVTVGDFTTTEASTSAPGSITGSITIEKGGTSDSVTINKTIEKLPTHTHVYKWIITKEPTPESAGEMTGICTCGEKTIEAIPKTGESGTIIVKEDAQNECKGVLTDKADVKGKVTLTDEEKEEIKDGTDLEIILRLKDVHVTVNTPEKSKISDKLGTNTLGTFLDIDLLKKIGDIETPITETTDEIKITFEVPERIRNTDSNVKRTYRIMRNHGGKVETLDAEIYDETTHLLTFRTNRFSTYALVYQDESKKPDTPKQPDATETPAGSSSPIVTKKEQPIVTKKEQEQEQEQESNKLSVNVKLKVSQTGKKIKVSWGKISGADGYDVYVQYCAKDFTKKSIIPIKSGKRTKVTVKKINGKPLNLKKNYKIYVLAYKLVDGKKITLSKTITVHIVGKKNTKYTNVKAVKVKKSSYTLKKGKKAQIKARTILVSPGKKQLSNLHAKQFRYATTNEKVATVSKKGKIKAVGKGTCTVYVYARNGYAKKIKVKVK